MGTVGTIYPNLKKKNLQHLIKFVWEICFESQFAHGRREKFTEEGQTRVLCFIPSSSLEGFSSRNYTKIRPYIFFFFFFFRDFTTSRNPDQWGRRRRWKSSNGFFRNHRIEEATKTQHLIRRHWQRTQRSEALSQLRGSYPIGFPLSSTKDAEMQFASICHLLRRCWAR